MSPKPISLGEIDREDAGERDAISMGEIDREAEADRARDLTGDEWGDGDVRFLAASFNEVERAFTPAPYSSAFCTRLVFGEVSSVGFALRCCCVVFGIFSVLWQKKVVAVEFVKFDCLMVALCRKLKQIERK